MEEWMLLLLNYKMERVLFGAHDLSIGVSYAQKLTDAFHFGGSVKLVQQKIYDMSAEALAIDLGFLLKKLII